MAMIIKPNGETKNVTPNQDQFTHQELNKLVVGYIEVIRLNDEWFMVINEEGKLQNLPYNTMATMLYQSYVSPYDCIVGNAVLVSSNEID